MKGFGYNILADKLARPNARHQGRWIRLDTFPFDWNGIKGTPRPTETYRPHRREHTKWLRRVAKRKLVHATTNGPHENVI